MAMDRRQAIFGLSASFAALLTSRFALADERTLYAAARREADGGFSAVIFDADGADIASVPLPGRGHDLTLRPGSAECVAIARRPGCFGVAFAGDSRAPVWFEATQGRHFYGHGAFSTDGRLFYTSENHYEAGRGVIGVRDAGANYRHIGEFPSYGVDPHDLLIVGDGKMLAVANGGIATHPDSGRSALNPSVMEPSLVYIDLSTGGLIEKVELGGGLQKLSIRHLAAGCGGRLVFGCQYEGAPEDQPPLLGFHRPGEAAQLAAAPASIHAGLKNYVGSVAADASGEIIAASSPRGGLVTFWDARTRRFMGHRSLEDVCGIADAPAHKSFLMTTGLGVIESCEPQGYRSNIPGATALRPVSWDNHIIRIKG